MLSSIISLCEKNGLLRKKMVSNLKLEQLNVGPMGTLLMQNLKNEWYNNIVINKENTVFFSDHKNFVESFEFAKNICLDRLPFGLAEVVHNNKCNNQQLLNSYEEKENREVNNVQDFEGYFGSDSYDVLKCTMFVSPSTSLQYFHQWQRQRRIWWRRFSPNPGRYALTDIKTDENEVQSVQIMAKYPWNSQLLETLVLHPKPKLVNESVKFKEGKKLISPHTVESNINLNTLFMNTICDAYDESDYKGLKRTLLRFHRKVAPYRISFAVSAAAAASLAELSDLALYLTKQLRTNNISTLLLPSSSRLSLENQWKQYDELGIPYNVLLNEKTLKDGLALLRSRDTTLKEQVHVTELVSYVELLFRNY